MKASRLSLGILLTLTLATTVVSKTVAFIPQIHLLFAGNVELRRSNWLRYQPVNAPVTLNPNDLIRATQRTQVKILCSDLSIRVVQVGQMQVSNICPSSDKPILKTQDSFIGSSRGGSDRLIPFLITPRRTVILDDKPLLHWNAVPNATSYRIRLHGSSGMRWETEVSRNQVVYPGEPPLEQGEMYAVVVAANTGASSVQEGIAGIGFSLLEENEAQEVRDAARQLAEQELSDEAKALALAHLYRRHNLMAEAIETLEAFVDQGNPTAASYQLLGDCYRQIRLNLHAIDAYLKAVELAVTPENIELKAEAQMAIGEIYIALQQFEQAVSLLKEARTNYMALEGLNSEKIIEIDSRLENLKL